MSTDKNSVRWYDDHAAEYTAHVRDQNDSIYHSLYEKPAMHELLPELQEKTVLSLGCGSGEDCDFLAGRGATDVHGIDISEAMIDIASRTYPDYSFQVMDMEQLAFEDAAFDFVYSSLAVHYIEDWTQLFSEVYRVLKPGSSFLFSCNHPVYSALQTTQEDAHIKRSELSRTSDRDAHTSTIVGDYLSRKPITQQGDGTMAVTTWHKSIGEICSEATIAGFMIQNIIEPVPLPKMKDVSPANFETLSKIPNFIIFKLIKENA
jgi:ubiquinone/menaquinone biosynthesis C-methylase UbiE